MSLCEGCEEALDLGGISGRRAFFIFPLLDRLVVPARLVHRRARIPPRLRSRKEMALAKIARGLAVPGKGLRHPGPRCLRPRRDPPWFCLFLPRRLHLWPALVSPEPRQRALHLPSRPASPCGASGSPEI